MKKLLFFLLVLFTTISSNAQKIDYELLVNGNLHQLTLSKSSDNLITVTGTGCDQFLISGSSMTLTKTDNGFLAVPSPLQKSASIEVIGIARGKRIALGRINFAIVE